MRRNLVLILVAGLLAASCGENTAVTSTNAGESSTTTEGTTTLETTTTTEPVTTTTEPLPGAYQVEEVDTCVIGLAPGTEVNVRSGPDSTYDIVDTLAEDATGVRTTGWGVLDSDGEEWRQMVLGDGTAWVFSAFLTPGTCTLGPPIDYCSNEPACTDVPNVRTGLGIAYDIVGTLSRNAVDVPGTGATARDGQGRTWVQVHHQGKVGWVAGWLLDPEPCIPTSCPPPALPWIITEHGVGPITLGLPITDLGDLTGLDWSWQEPGAEGCLWGSTSGVDAYLQADEGAAVDHIWVHDASAAVTEAGIHVGDTRTALNTTYGAHIVNVTDDGYSGVAVWVDLGSDGTADMIAVFDGPGPLEPIHDIRVPAILAEGGCL
jgi:uncharacterized protein YraI